MIRNIAQAPSLQKLVEFKKIAQKLVLIDRGQLRFSNHDVKAVFAFFQYETSNGVLQFFISYRRRAFSMIIIYIVLRKAQYGSLLAMSSWRLPSNGAE